MPTKTVYVSESDLKLWERAQHLLGEGNVSSVVIDCLRQKVERKESAMQGMSKITVQEESPTGRIVNKTFNGRWLIDPEEQWAPEDPFWQIGGCVAVAETANGNFAIFYHNRDEVGKLIVYPSLESLLDAETEGGTMEGLEERLVGELEGEVELDI